MEIDAIILAGGQGTRLRSVYSGPKVLAPVHGRPFVSYLIAQLADAGLHRAIVSIGYLADTVAKTLGERCMGLELCYSFEETPRGTGGGVRRAAERATSDNILILNGDSYCEV